MPVSDGCLVERYEQLRSQALGRWTGSASRLGLMSMPVENSPFVTVNIPHFSVSEW